MKLVMVGVESAVIIGKEKFRLSPVEVKCLVCDVLKSANKKLFHSPVCASESEFDLFFRFLSKKVPFNWPQKVRLRMCWH